MGKKGKEKQVSPEEMNQSIIDGFNKILAMEEVELETMLKMRKNMQNVLDNMQDDLNTMTALCQNKKNVLLLLGKITGQDTSVINSLTIE